VPLDAGTGAARLDKGLVVPEADRPPVQQLAGRKHHRVEERDVMEGRLATPVAEAVEEHLARASGLVVVELVEQIQFRMRVGLVAQRVEVAPQLLELALAEHGLRRRDEAVAVEAFYLVRGQSER